MTLVVTSALYIFQDDPVIVDHLLAEVFLELNLFVRSKEKSLMIDALALVSIKIFTYLEVLRKSFRKTLISSDSRSFFFGN